MILRLATLALALAASGQAAIAQSRSGDRQVERQIAIDSPSHFAASAQRIRAQMKPGGRYGLIGEADRARVEARLRQMEMVFDQAGPAHDTSHDQQLELLDAKRQIARLLDRNDSNNLVCETHPNIGCAFR
jgi:hypothetical protein